MSYITANFLCRIGGCTKSKHTRQVLVQGRVGSEKRFCTKSQQPQGGRCGYVRQEAQGGCGASSYLRRIDWQDSIWLKVDLSFSALIL
jgi:hypothetical protein